MIQFDIPLDKYFLQEDSGVCEIRKKVIRFNSEEKTRQALVRYLVAEKGYPRELISIEEHMAHHEPGALGRADLVVYYDGLPLILIECKRENKYLNDFVLDQVLKYDETLKAGSIALVAGNKAVFAFFDEDDNLVFHDEIPSFKQLIGLAPMELSEIEYEPFAKFPLNDDSFKLFVDEAVIGRDTHKKYHPFLVNYYNFFRDEEDVLDLERYGIIDSGIKEVDFGNVSGGEYPGIYRSFQMPDKKTMVNISISSSSRGEGYPENTILIVAIEKGKIKHNSLQLKVDDNNIEISNGKVSIYHDCKITVGKQGAAKKKDLLEFVKTKAPQLIAGDRVLLGSFDEAVEIIASLPETKSFIKNLSTYALVRDEFRDLKKAGVL